MKYIKPKPEPLNLSKFLKAKVLQWDIPYKDLMEVAKYAVSYSQMMRCKKRWANKSKKERSIIMTKVSHSR